MTSIHSALNPISKLGLGCWAFGGKDWGGQRDEDSLAAMSAAWEAGITHWDTALGYGSGRSERLCGNFLQGKWDRVFLATKANIGRKPDSLIKSLHKSLKNLGTDSVNLFYIHYPRSGLDMRPHMELLERERDRGTIGAIGISNFSVAQMEHISEAGRIDVCQIGYNLLWRRPEKDIIPWCIRHGIAIVTYGTLAMGILTGKFPERPTFAGDDVRPVTVYFREEVWPGLCTTTQKLNSIADRCGIPLHHLAIRWAAAQPGISSVLVGARNAEQVKSNAEAWNHDLPENILEELSALSDDVDRLYGDETSIFGYHP